MSLGRATLYDQHGTQWYAVAIANEIKHCSSRIKERQSCNVTCWPQRRLSPICCCHCPLCVFACWPQWTQIIHGKKATHKHTNHKLVNTGHGHSPTGHQRNQKCHSTVDFTQFRVIRVDRASLYEIQRYKQSGPLLTQTKSGQYKTTIHKVAKCRLFICTTSHI